MAGTGDVRHERPSHQPTNRLNLDARASILQVTARPVVLWFRHAVHEDCIRVRTQRMRIQTATEVQDVQRLPAERKVLDENWFGYG